MIVRESVFLLVVVILHIHIPITGCRAIFFTLAIVPAVIPVVGVLVGVLVLFVLLGNKKHLENKPVVDIYGSRGTRVSSNFAHC